MDLAAPANRRPPPHPVPRVCNGASQVTFAPYNLTISKWDDTTKNYTLLGKIESHAIVGKQDTWQMYLHGPRVSRMPRPLTKEMTLCGV